MFFGIGIRSKVTAELFLISFNYLFISAMVTLFSCDGVVILHRNWLLFVSLTNA